MLNYPFCLMNVRYSALIEQRQLEVSHQSSEEFLSPPPSSIEPQLNEPITRTTAVAVEGMFPSSIRGISESWGLCIWPGFAVTHGQRTYLMWRPSPPPPLQPPCLARPVGLPVQTSRLLPLLGADMTARVWMLTLRANSKQQPNAEQTKAKNKQRVHIAFSVMSSRAPVLTQSLSHWLICCDGGTWSEWKAFTADHPTSNPKLTHNFFWIVFIEFKPSQSFHVWIVLTNQLCKPYNIQTHTQLNSNNFIYTPGRNSFM